MRRPPDPPRPGQRVCTQPGCGRKHVARGWCALHYMRDRQNTPMDAVACWGAIEDIPGSCGHLHPAEEPPDPPIPAWLIAYVDQALAAWLG
jgi:hypothetical protein